MQAQEKLLDEATAAIGSVEDAGKRAKDRLATAQRLTTEATVQMADVNTLLGELGQTEARQTTEVYFLADESLRTSKLFIFATTFTRFCCSCV